jgi:hypothetical protein
MKYLLLLLLAGCANSTPYIEAEIKYAFPFSTDYWVHQDRTWTCNQPYQLDLEIGHEWKNGWSGGLYHESFFLCGSPFNHAPEIYENGIFAKKKWGGW